MIDLIVSAGSALFGGGVVWGVTRNRIENLRQDHSELKAEVVGHKREDTRVHSDMTDRLARLETKADMILDELRRHR